jgi:hypothetical protein
MSVRNRAIIIIVNGMPRLYVDELIKELHSTHDVHLLTFYQQTELLDDRLVATCVNLGAQVRQFKFRSKVEELAQIILAGRVLRKWIGEAQSVDIFHCQPNHLLTNYPTFRARQENPDRVRIHLIPDGLANFYLTRSTPYEGTMRQKRIIGRAVGLPFHPYKGSYLALEEADYEDYWHIGNPGIMPHYLPTHRFNVGLGQARPTRRHHKWIFFGQPSQGRQFVSEYEKVLDRVASLSTGGVVYKPHPAEELHGQLKAALTRLDIEVLETSEPAERIALGYEAAAGVASSVLFNLAMMATEMPIYMVKDQTKLGRLTVRAPSELEQILVAADKLGIHDIFADSK